MTFDKINLLYEEGKMLLASICFISTTNRTNRTPCEILEEIEELKNKMMFDDMGFENFEKIDDDMGFENLDKELDELDDIEFYRTVDIKINMLKKLKQEPLELDLLSDDALMEKYTDKYFGHFYRQVFEARQRFRRDIVAINDLMKNTAKEEIKKILK
jgi:hypothetical protein